MKTKLLVLFASVISSFSAQSQEFTNLDFEGSYVAPDSRIVVPGWTHSDGADTDLYFIRGHLGITQCYFLTESNFALAGQHSMSFSSGYYLNDDNAPFIHAYIAQTGRIPADAVSLRFLARGALKVFIDGVDIPMTALGNELFEGDIRGFAGKLSELKIVNSTNIPQTPLVVDDVSFAPAAISHVFWQNDCGATARWTIGASTIYSAQVISNLFGSAWRMVAQADFNADGSTDFLFQSDAGALAIQFMRGKNVVGRVGCGTAGPRWKVFCAEDMNNDGAPDILFQHQDGRLAAWFMQGTNLIRSTFLGQPAPDQRAVASSDFNGDSHKDILLQSTSQKLIVCYGPDFGTIRPLRKEPVGPGWQAVGMLDRLVDDSSTGILFQNINGRVSLWRMDGTNVLAAISLGRAAADGWRIVGAK